ncbi:hypothetical protein IMSAG117_00109 [Lactobacillaceae bacterium]|jgi:hypothetical protein|nr:hypothetical protein IMSAG117_00109 [Lactobacillaceae bacterium]
MFGNQIGVIVEHIFCTLNSLVDQSAIFGVTHNGNETQGIHNQRYHNKEQTAEKEKLKGLLFRKMSDGIPDKQDSESGAGIDPRPLGGNAQSHTDAAEGKGKINAFWWKFILHRRG